MNKPLVLSLFPGIGLLDAAFEEEGFCVVRGPDLLWGGDIRSFNPPAGRFDGVIGGPPCQTHSRMRSLALTNGSDVVHEDQIPEFARVVNETRPVWFVMENVRDAYAPTCPEYFVQEHRLNNRWLGEDQSRLRCFWFGVRDGRPARLLFDGLSALDSIVREPTVLAGHGEAIGQRRRGFVGRTWQEGARLQGLSPEWIAHMEQDAPFTVHGLKKVIGNGVPLPMGRAVARAVKKAMGYECAA
jgi:DNA (cytosine-5)-methyltransferase 1